jgi:hypothetical protein
MRGIFVIAAAAAWIAGATFAGGSAWAQAREIDRLLAAVNGKVVTELDLRIARTLDAVLQYGKNAAPLSPKEELDQIINQELIRQEMENFPISESDKAQVEKEVQAKVGELRNSYAEIGGLPALLSQLGIDQSELVAKIRTLVLSEKFISLRFGPFVSVSDQEVQNYYRDRLEPQLRQKGIAIPPLAAVSAQISALLREEKKNQEWFKWIDNVKAHSRIEYFTGKAGVPAEGRK